MKAYALIGALVLATAGFETFERYDYTFTPDKKAIDDHSIDGSYDDGAYSGDMPALKYKAREYGKGFYDKAKRYGDPWRK